MTPTIVRRRARVRRRRGAPGRRRARARRRVPARAGRPHARARAVRRPRARRVRRARARRHHLRADHRGALPRLDVAGRRDQQPHHGRADRAAPRHRGAARAASCRASPAARRAAGSASPSRTPAPTCRPSAPPRVRDGDHYVVDRQQDVHHQRPRGPRLRAAGHHRPARPAAPPRHVVLHRREGPSGLPRREVAGQARLQGRRHGRAALRGRARCRPPTWSAASRAAASVRS